MRLLAGFVNARFAFAPASGQAAVQAIFGSGSLQCTGGIVSNFIARAFRLGATTPGHTILLRLSADPQPVCAASTVEACVARLEPIRFPIAAIAARPLKALHTEQRLCAFVRSLVMALE